MFYIIYNNTKARMCIIMKYSQVVEKFLRYLENIDRSSETLEGYKKELAYFGEFLLDKYMFYSIYLIYTIK